jgi:hypothetical protein
VYQKIHPLVLVVTPGIGREKGISAQVFLNSGRAIIQFSQRLLLQQETLKIFLHHVRE